MSDTATTAHHHGRDAGDGDARVEQLLLGGLDHYFAGRYEQAVHVWTRVLFLDRGHARARAYIERARSAVAERQRHSEELLHRGTAAFEDGQVASARRLLTAAVEHGAATDVALAYLERLDRLSSSAPAVPALAPPQHRPADPIEQTSSGERSRRGMAAWSLAVVAVLLTLIWVVDVVRTLGGFGVPAAAVSSATDSLSEPLPVVRASDVAVARARSLFETGHAADAMRLLATIPIGDPNRAEADRVLADIQRTLWPESARPATRTPLP